MTWRAVLHWMPVGLAILLLIAGIFINDLKVESWVSGLMVMLANQVWRSEVLDKKISVVAEKLDSKLPADAQAIGIARLLGQVSTDGRSGEAVSVMARRALGSFLRGEFGSQVDQLMNFLTNDDQHYLRFENKQLIGKAVRELETLLPDGGVWCGISLISSASWKEEPLQTYLTESRARARDGALSVYRLYVVASPSDELDNHIRLEKENNIHVRRMNAREGVEDVSLVWAPKSIAKRLGSDDFQSAITRDHEPLALLKFRIENGGLSEMTAYRGDSKEFSIARDSFVRHWRAAERTLR
ncbi:MAG: hypothetical protein OXU70_11140 [Gammaproteobacteria bacterium]|nr:hypothetical protein [Gammaproteobacteria bacterium]